jgi:hypothetical protein
METTTTAAAATITSSSSATIIVADDEKNKHIKIWSRNTNDEAYDFSIKSPQPVGNRAKQL